MPQKFKDNGRALLQSSITTGSLSLTVEAAKADRFPTGNTTNWLAPVDWFKCVLINSAGDREVIRVGTRTLGSGVFGNILRAQDGTTALAFTAGSVVVQAPFAADLENCLAGTFPVLTVTGTSDTAGRMRQAGVEGRYIPVGGIIDWSGTLVNIPAGWQLCDGTNGTPNLLNRFVIGAAPAGAPIGTTGGVRDAIVPAHVHRVNFSVNTSNENSLHTHGATVNDAGHAHNYTFKSAMGGSNAGADPNSIGNTTAVTSVATSNITVSNSTQSVVHQHVVSVDQPTESTGASPSDANMPPYYVLAKIMCMAA